MIEKLTTYIRILLGLVYAINGFNWFFKIITPYPSMSDFVNFMPPPDIVGAMIDQGVMFHAAKAIELVTGIALLTNRFVPLSLVAAMAVTVPVFIVDVFKPELRLRSFLMGTGSLTINTTLLIAYYHHYRPMFNWKAAATTQPGAHPLEQGDSLADALGRLAQALQPVLTIVSALLGTVMVIWLLVMIGQYVADPKSISEVHELVPRIG
jgi:hypothetical protein